MVTDDDLDTAPFVRANIDHGQRPEHPSKGPAAANDGATSQAVPTSSVLAGLRELRDATPRQRAIHDRFDLGGEGGEA
jgi:hypothetical protein